MTFICNFLRSRKNICQRVPRGVRHHAAYVVDTTYLEANIVSYGDDNGSWTGHTKPIITIFIEDTFSLNNDFQKGPH